MIKYIDCINLDLSNKIKKVIREKYINKVLLIENLSINK
jgi:hypothetical protein